MSTLLPHLPQVRKYFTLVTAALYATLHLETLHATLQLFCFHSLAGIGGTGLCTLHCSTVPPQLLPSTSGITQVPVLFTKVQFTFTTFCLWMFKGQETYVI